MVILEPEQRIPGLAGDRENGSLSSGPDLDAGTQILTTKLHRPAIAGAAVLRHRLLKRLDLGFSLPLTLISAPAGYGKTVLASQWLASTSHRSIWLSIDEGDSQLESFLSYLVASVRTIFPEALVHTSHLLGGPGSVPSEVLQRAVANELDELPERAIIVVDDYHRMRSEGVHAFLAALLAHPPSQLHLALLTRTDPPLPLASMRAHGQISEIRAAELRLVTDEIGAVILAERGEEPPPGAVSAIEAATEGWPAGVRLLLEASRHRDRSGGVRPSASLLDSARARDFLISEVLNAQPSAIRGHLLASSVLDQFCAPLCDAMVAGDDLTGAAATPSGQEFLNWLQQADLFVTGLDDSNTWFRYHHLFREMLQRQLVQAGSSSQLRKLHRRAEEWLSAQGLIEEAFKHALKAEDWETAARLAALHGQALLEREEFRTLERWLARVPAELMLSNPELLVLEAWLAGDALSQLQRMADLLGRVEALLEAGASDGDGFVTGSVEALRAFALYLMGDGERAAQRADHAARLMPAGQSRCLAFAIVLKITGLQMAGRVGEAVEVARLAMRESQLRSSSFPPWNWALTYVWWLEADMGRMYRRGAALSRHGREAELQDTIANGEYSMGVACYERNKPAPALEHFAAAAEHPYAVQSETHVQAVIGQALCHVALGHSDIAREMAEDLAEFTLGSTSAYLQRIADAFLVELALRQGHHAAAERWLGAHAYSGLPQRFDDPSADLHAYMRYSPIITHMKALLALGTDDGRDQADELLAGELIFAEGTHNRPALIQLLGLRALLDEARGDDEAALHELKRAVAESQPGGAVRLLADLGPGLAKLLTRLQVDGDNLAHAAAVLQAIGLSSGKLVSESPEPTAAAIDSPDIELLTPRELNVLALLARRYTNKEIARELVIAPETVKKHTISLYRKLNVGGRREAVKKAKALGYFREN